MNKWLALVALGGCTITEPVKVAVNCATNKTNSLECSVTQTQGKSEVEACWDFAITCGNGTIVKAPKTCQKVKEGGTEKVTVPADKLTNLERCAGDAKAAISGLMINGKPAEL